MSADWWDEQTPAAAPVAQPVQPIDEWLDSHLPKRPAKPLAAAPRPGKRQPQGIPAAEAWVVFRTTEDGIEHVRVVRGSDLNRLRPGEARDWTHDVPFLGPDDATAQAAWGRWMRSWVFVDQVEACEQMALIEGLQWLADQTAWAKGAK